MAKRFRKLTASSYDEAKAQLKPGETLVVTNGRNKRPAGEGHVPITSERSYRIQTEVGHGDVYARSEDDSSSS